MKNLIWILLLSQISCFAYAGLFGPTNYHECILEEMPGVKNDQVVRSISMECSEKYPVVKKQIAKKPYVRPNKSSINDAGERVYDWSHMPPEAWDQLEQKVSGNRLQPDGRMNNNLTREVLNSFRSKVLGVEGEKPVAENTGVMRSNLNREVLQRFRAQVDGTQTPTSTVEKDDSGDFLNGLIRAKTWQECFIEHGKSVSNKLALRLIRTACGNLYPIK